MKIVLFIAALAVVFSSQSQYSYYFAEPLPSASDQVENVAEKYFGSYKTKDGTLTYKFDAEGVTIISTTIGSISKATVRESANYTVRNGYLFGVEKNDSVPCILEDGFYFFGVRNFDIYVGAGSKNVLTKTSTPGEYVLNEFENGRYIPIIFRFNGRKLEIAHFDYEGESASEFDYVESKEELPMDGLKLIILKPETTDYERIASQAFVGDMELKRTSR
ncbi:MAG: hypothetical protein Crog4KO_20980 [Crocinitomicaceae bacterium]